MDINTLADAIYQRSLPHIQINESNPDKLISSEDIINTFTETIIDEEMDWKSPENKNFFYTFMENPEEYIQLENSNGNLNGNQVTRFYILYGETINKIMNAAAELCVQKYQIT